MLVAAVVVAVVVVMLGGWIISRQDRSKRRVLRKQIGRSVTLLVAKPASGLQTSALDERTVVVDAVEGSEVVVSEQSSVSAIELSRIREVRDANHALLARW